MTRTKTTRRRSRPDSRHGISRSQKGLIRQHVDDQVRSGFLSDAEISQSVLESFHGEAPVSVLKRVSKVFTKKARLAVRADSAKWPKVTDCDRLDLAFAQLNDLGILARQSFSCCTSCGVDEIDRELRFKKHGSKIGYVFFTRNDACSAVHGLLCLAFGSRDATPASMRRVAKAVVACLLRHKLKARWSGDIDEKILVRVKWQNRRCVMLKPQLTSTKPRSSAFSCCTGRR
jgi:hypothetical protein